jgi:hypothetical protein
MNVLSAEPSALTQQRNQVLFHAITQGMLDLTKHRIPAARDIAAKFK